MKALVLIFFVCALLAILFYELLGEVPEDDARGVFPAIASAFFSLLAALDFVLMLAYLIYRSM